MVYYGLTFNTTNLGGNDYVNFALAGIVGIPAIVFYQVSVMYCGRRWLITGSMIFGGVALMLILAVPAGTIWACLEYKYIFNLI